MPPVTIARPVKKSGASENSQIVERNGNTLCKENGICGDALGMGLGFELPVVILTLVKIDILSYATLRKMWRYMIVICLVLGAFLTTSEVVTQVLMAGPLYLLYEGTIWVAWYWEQPDRAKARRMLLLALLMLIALGVVAYLYGWPWLRHYWH